MKMQDTSSFLWEVVDFEVDLKRIVLREMLLLLCHAIFGWQVAIAAVESKSGMATGV